CTSPSCEAHSILPLSKVSDALLMPTAGPCAQPSAFCSVVSLPQMAAKPPCGVDVHLSAVGAFCVGAGVSVYVGVNEGVSVGFCVGAGVLVEVGSVGNAAEVANALSVLAGGGPNTAVSPGVGEGSSATGVAVTKIGSGVGRGPSAEHPPNSTPATIKHMSLARLVWRNHSRPTPPLCLRGGGWGVRFSFIIYFVHSASHCAH